MEVLENPIEAFVAAARGLSAGYPRDALKAAVRAVAGIEDGASAWETLATRGLIPFGWVDDPSREFLLPGPVVGVVSYLEGDHDTPLGHSGPSATVRGTSSSSSHDLKWFTEPPEVGDLVRMPNERSHYLARAFGPSPPDVATAVALAAMAEVVTRAEVLCGELLERLHPWGAWPNTRLIWKLSQGAHNLPGGDRSFYPWRFPGSIEAALSSLMGKFARARGAENEFSLLREAAESRLAAEAPDASSGRGSLVHTDATAAMLWRSAARRELMVGVGYSAYVPKELLGTSFASLRNPFWALLATYALGVCPDDTRGPNLILRLPPLGDDLERRLAPRRRA